MAPKGKSRKPTSDENPPTSTPVNLDHVPLVDSYYKIADTECEFEFHELHLWLEQKYLEQQDEIKLWESLLPLFSFHQTHDFPDLVI